MLSTSRGIAWRWLTFVTAPVSRWQWLILTGAILFFLWFYFYIAAELIRQVNQDRQASDQQLHILLAHLSHDDWWPLRTDGVTNPLWSWIAARFDPGDEQTLFVRGKWFNVAVTATFLAGLTFWSARKLTLLASINLLVIAGLGVFLQRCAYFQPEPLYYIFFFGSWVAACALLRRNSVWLYLLLGGCSGLAYLAKPSIAPLLAVFLGVSSLRALHSWWTTRRTDSTPGDWSWKRHLIGLGVFALGHAIIIAPRALHATRTFGSPLHNYPSYFMWFDDQAKCQPWANAHNTAEKLRNLTPAERPSLSNYLRTHTAGECWNRLAGGTTAKVQTFLVPDPRAKLHYFIGLRNSDRPWKFLLSFRGLYLLLPLLLVAIFTGVAQSRSPMLMRANHPAGWILLFCLGTFAIYALATGWYHQIARGDRFMLAMFAPLLFTIFLAAENLRRMISSPAATAAYTAIHGFMLYLVLTRIVNLVAYPIFQSKFG